jgi:hypothetical protein
LLLGPEVAKLAVDGNLLDEVRIAAADEVGMGLQALQDRPHFRQGFYRSLFHKKELRQAGHRLRCSTCQRVFPFRVLDEEIDGVPVCFSRASRVTESGQGVSTVVGAVLGAIGQHAGTEAGALSGAEAANSGSGVVQLSTAPVKSFTKPEPFAAAEGYQHMSEG